MGGVARELFKPGSGGFVVLMIMMLAVTGSIAETIASSMGKGNLSRLISIVIQFSAIGMVIVVVTATVVSFFRMIGL